MLLGSIAFLLIAAFTYWLTDAISKRATDARVEREFEKMWKRDDA